MNFSKEEQKHTLTFSHLGFPSKLLIGLPRVSHQLLDLRGSVELGVDPDPDQVSALLPAELLVPGALPHDLLADVLERGLDK